jgi:peroxiredoxin Q/BCP
VNASARRGLLVAAVLAATTACAGEAGPATGTASATATATGAVTAAAAATAASAATAAPAGIDTPGPLAAGTAAPDFKAAVSDGTTLALSDLKGKPVVLYFYPRDETPG